MASYSKQHDNLIIPRRAKNIQFQPGRIQLTSFESGETSTLRFYRIASLLYEPCTRATETAVPPLLDNGEPRIIKLSGSGTDTESGCGSTGGTFRASIYAQRGAERSYGPE